MEVIAGIAIMTTVFWSVFGVLRLSIEVIFNNKAKVGALALANEQVEFLRSLAYDDVGTVGGIPNGNIPQNETITLNSIDYNRRTFIQYVDDPKDGEGGSDENSITADYKRAKVEISWINRGENQSVFLVTNIVPKGMESVNGGGTLVINVFDAFGSPITGAEVHIENNELAEPISVDAFTNTSGEVIFPGSPVASSYEITVTKSGYSTAQTYGVEGENTNPNPGHLTVEEGVKTTASFAIDLLADKIVKTYSATGENIWKDLFADGIYVADFEHIKIENGELMLASTTVSMTGYAQSIEIDPDYLVEWIDFSWNDNVPASTTMSYQLFYENSSSTYSLVPNIDLPNNSTGFSSSPVDISGLSTTTYDRLKMQVSLGTDSTTTTPSLQDWQIRYTAGPTPLPNIDFNMRGDKTVGERSDNSLIYKYEEDLQTNGAGLIDLEDLEWDNYLITIDNDTLNLDISEICEPQPFSLDPGADVVTEIILSPQTSNSLLISITDSSSMELLDNVSVRLYKIGFNNTQSTAGCGQTFFNSLSSGSYDIDLSKSGYLSKTVEDVDVSDASNIQITLDAE